MSQTPNSSRRRRIAISPGGPSSPPLAGDISPLTPPASPHNSLSPTQRPVRKRSSSFKRRQSALIRRQRHFLSTLKTIIDPAELYTLTGTLGAGQYGRVHRALRVSDGTTVAIKVQRLEGAPELDSDSIGAETLGQLQGELIALERELSSLRECAHPNVISLIDSFYVPDTFEVWIVLACAVSSLKDAIGALGAPLRDEVVVAGIVRCVLHGIQYIHKLGKCHRDIKCSNLLIGECGGGNPRALLGDFGIAAEVSDAQKRQSFIGTPLWIAPEIITEASYGPSCDLWSLGISIIEMIEGNPPFSDIPPMRAVFLIPQRPSPSLKPETQTFFGPKINDFLSQCLKKDPRERATASDLLSHPFLTQYSSSERSRALARFVSRVQERFDEFGGFEGYLEYVERKEDEEEGFDDEFELSSDSDSDEQEESSDGFDSDSDDELSAYSSGDDDDYEEEEDEEEEGEEYSSFDEEEENDYESERSVSSVERNDGRRPKKKKKKRKSRNRKKGNRSVESSSLERISSVRSIREKSQKPFIVTPITVEMPMQTDDVGVQCGISLELEERNEEQRRELEDQARLLRRCCSELLSDEFKSMAECRAMYSRPLLKVAEVFLSRAQQLISSSGFIEENETSRHFTAIESVLNVTDRVKNRAMLTFERTFVHLQVTLDSLFRLIFIEFDGKVRQLLTDLSAIRRRFERSMNRSKQRLKESETLDETGETSRVEEYRVDALLEVKLKRCKELFHRHLGTFLVDEFNGRTRALFDDVRRVSVSQLAHFLEANEDDFGLRISTACLTIRRKLVTAVDRIAAQVKAQVLTVQEQLQAMAKECKRDRFRTMESERVL